MEGDAEILKEVAHDYVNWNGTVLAALATLLDDIEIAAGLEDIFSINAFRAPFSGAPKAARVGAPSR
jgi:hypothetical protein